MMSHDRDSEGTGWVWVSSDGGNMELEEPAILKH